MIVPPLKISPLLGCIILPLTRHSFTSRLLKLFHQSSAVAGESDFTLLGAKTGVSYGDQSEGTDYRGKIYLKSPV